MSDDGLAHLADVLLLMRTARDAVAGLLAAQGCSASIVEREADRAARLALLLAESDRACTSREAAECLSVSQSTVKRDKRRLREAFKVAA
jgi:hypothetical protein